jgi:hypothetical protein
VQLDWPPRATVAPVTDEPPRDHTFICYAREDGDFALSLAGELRSRGVTIWIDKWSIEPAADWDRAIDDAIRACAAFVIVLSPDAVSSNEVRGELRRALNETKFIVPLLYRPCDVPRQLETVQYIDSTGVTSPSGSALQQLVDTIRRGRGMERPDDERPPRRPSPHSSTPSDREARNRSAVLEDVRAEAAARLAQTVQAGGLLTIFKERQPYQVTGSWDDSIKMAPVVRPSAPASIDITEAFDEDTVGGKLLILGRPGSGKTTALLQLARELSDRADANGAEPIPVLLNLSSWHGNEPETLTGWMLDELKLKYGVRRQFSRKWLDDRSLAPLLDGLDELPPDRQEACVLAINHFQQQHRPPYLVVCCRLAEYENFTVKLRLFGAVRLVPLDTGQIRDYLERVGTPDLWASISGDPESLELASSPLLLRMMTLAYQEISTQEWQRLGSARERRAYLFDVYIRHLLPSGATRDEGGYANEGTTRWLAWLASSLKRFGQEEFLLERMQPSWLSSRRQLWFYRIVVGLTVATLFVLADQTTGLVARLFPETPLRVELTTSSKLSWLNVMSGVPLSVLFGLAVAVVLATRPSITPIETLRWSASNAWRGIAQWLRKAVAGTLNYAVVIGLLAGVAIALTTTFGGIRVLGNPMWKAGQPVSHKIGLVLGVVPVLLWTIAMMTMPRASTWIRRGAGSAAMLQGANAALIAILVLLGYALSGRFIEAIAGAASGICFGIVAATSRALSGRAAARLAHGYGAGLLAWSGAVFVSAYGSDMTITGRISLWMNTGTGVAATTGLLAALGRGLLARRLPPDTAEPILLKRDLVRAWSKGAALGVAASLLIGAAAVVLGRIGQREVVRFVVLCGTYATATFMVTLGQGLIVALGTIVTAVGFAAAVGILIGLLKGLSGPDVAKRVIPNQGIRQSAVNVLVFAAIGGVAVGVPYGLVNVAVAALTFQTPVAAADVLRFALMNGLALGILGGCVPGAACVQHYALRFVLWCKGPVPLRYTRFLDYATERMLLQRVGGRYRFLHVLLRDHFAAMQSGRPSTQPATISDDLGAARSRPALH